MKSPVYPGLQVIIDILRDQVPDTSFNMAMGFCVHEISPPPANEREIHCGTACCIGGHAVVHMIYNQRDYKIPVYGEEGSEMRTVTLRDGAYYYTSQNYMHFALAELCDIPPEVAYNICWPPGTYRYDPEKYSKKDAITMLERCRDTGIVDHQEYMASQVQN